MTPSDGTDHSKSDGTALPRSVYKETLASTLLLAFSYLAGLCWPLPCHVSCYMERRTQTETERPQPAADEKPGLPSSSAGKEVNPANNHVSEHLSNLQVWLQTWLTPGLLPVLGAEASSKTIPRFPSHRHCRGRQVVYCFKHCWRVNKRQELISKASNEQTEETLGKQGLIRQREIYYLQRYGRIVKP